MRTRCITSQSVTCPKLTYFHSLSPNWRGFRKEVIVHKMCVLIFSRTFLRNICHSENNSALVLLQLYVPTFTKIEFSWYIYIYDGISNIPFHVNTPNVRPAVPRERKDEQTDITKVMPRLPKKWHFRLYRVSIKSFPDYKNLLQGNCCPWNTNIYYF
jgi:hypothetical protein